MTATEQDYQRSALKYLQPFRPDLVANVIPDYSYGVKFAHLRSSTSSDNRLAVIIDGGALFLDEHWIAGHWLEAPRDLQDLIERDERGLDEVRHVVSEALAAGNELVPATRFHFDSAVLRPPTMIAIGANYSAHAQELSLRTETNPTIFTLWSNSLSGHEGTTRWSTADTTQVDYEAELGVVTKKIARNIGEEKALDYVWGYTVVNDMTARDLQFSETQWSRCKSFDGFTPTGPYVVTADEIADPQDLHITADLDGKRVQDASTGEMTRTVAEIISYLAKTSSLDAGTLITTGSPGGAGYSRNPAIFLTDGSTITVGIDGIGALTTHCAVD